MEILFFNPDNAPPWLAQLGTLPDWRPVYLDETAVIYLKKGYAPGVPEMDNTRLLAGWGLDSSILKDADTLLQTPKPSGWDCFWGDFTQPVSYPLGLSTIGAYYYNTGHKDLAESLFLEIIRQTRGRYTDPFINLGSVYAHTNRGYETQLCKKRVIQDISPDIIARLSKTQAAP